MATLATDVPLADLKGLREATKIAPEEKACRMDIPNLGSIAVVAAVVGFWFWARSRDKRKEARWAEDAKKREEERLSDEGIAKAQHEFEKCLREGEDLPDGIRGRDAYAYWHLMREWYGTLAARHRYDGQLQQLKKDWLDYLNLKESYATSRFLYSESEGERREEYGHRAYDENQKIEAIEAAFAHAVGPPAVAALKIFRKAEHYAFDRSGRKEMAPSGYHYKVVSVSPYIEDLVPTKPKRG